MESRYVTALYKFLNSGKFIRSFKGKCPECGAELWSVGDDVVDNRIKAKFICDCGKKYKEVVYSPKMKKYKYTQAVGVDFDTSKGVVKVLKHFDDYYRPVPAKGKVLVKRKKRG